MSKNLYLYLARHGQTQWNINGKLQGQRNSDLTLKGRQQAQQLALQLLAKNISAIYCSPLGRAINTATICAKSLSLSSKALTPHAQSPLTPIPQVLTPKVLAGLQERHLGLWQGQSKSQLKHQPRFERLYYNKIRTSTLTARPPKGESLGKALVRFNQALQWIVLREKTGAILVVSHGDIIEKFIQTITPKNRFIEALSLKEKVIDNGEIITLVFDDTNQTFLPAKNTKTFLL